MRVVVLLALPFCLPALAQSTVVGSTPGAFRVTESGAAEYRIPIRVPPGIAGMEPKLALAYNSQGGNGPLGIGWRLEGLSAITRCPRTMGQDGWRGGVNHNANDRFCLDGQRLMATTGAYGADGTEYRTERESFSRIVSYGAAGTGPAWFKVWTKSGQVLEYGNTADSRVEAQGKTTVRAWALNKTADRHGNQLTATYAEDSAYGTHAVTRIDYAGNSVRFVYYPTRTDVLLGYEAGSRIRTPTLLTNVRSYIGETQVKDYRIQYTLAPVTRRSKVIGVTECAGTQCFPAHTFSWQDGGTGWMGGDATMPASWNPQRVWAGDFNGDGKTDLVSLQESDTSYGQRRYVKFLSDGGGGWTAADSPMPVPWNPQYVWTGDFNGDGRTDLVSLQDPDPSYGQRRYVKFLSDGGGGWTAADSPMPVPWNPQYTWAGDFNGDGITDLVSLQEPDASFGQRRYVIFFSDGGGGWTAADSPMPSTWNPQYVWTGDFNGDGLTDLLSLQDSDASFGQRRYVIFYSNGVGGWTTADSPMPASWNPQYVWTGDFNGDGKTDIVSLQEADSSYGQRRYVIFFSDGGGGWVPSDSPMPTTWSPQRTWAVDLNGDGLTDLVSVQEPDAGYGQRRYVIYYSDGSVGWTYEDSPMPASWNPQYVWTGDINGDGKSDLVSLQDPDGSYGQRRYAVFRAGAPFPDLLTNVTDGNGAAVTVAYTPLTNGSVYVKDAGASAAVYPNVDLQSPLYVAQAVNSSNGIGGTRAATHSYGGLKSNAAGRGFLGFRWMESTDSATGLQTRTESRQDWPYVGMPSLVRRTQSSGALLSQATSTLSCTNPSTGGACTMAAGNRYFPFTSQSVESGNDLNGTALPTVTTTTQYDGYGNPTSITTGTGDGHSKTTTNTFANDIVNWLLGRLTRSTVQSTSP